jgi:hypothetical protein
MYSSLKSKDEFMLDTISLPIHLQFGNYYKAFVEGQMYKYFISSAFNGIPVHVEPISFFARTGNQRLSKNASGRTNQFLWPVHDGMTAGAVKG